MSFVHIVKSILVNDSFFFARAIFVSIMQILQFVTYFFPINDSFTYIERAPF